MSKVQFIHHDRRPALRNRKRLKLFLEDLFKHERRALENLCVIFCSDKHLLGINKQFLKHDFYTDIISFDLSAPGAGAAGEIYISVDRIEDNARKLETTYQEELHRVIFHGALHLCGYKDKNKEDVKEMRAAENKCLQQYFG